MLLEQLQVLLERLRFWSFLGRVGPEGSRGRGQSVRTTAVDSECFRSVQR